MTDEIMLEVQLTCGRPIRTQGEMDKCPWCGCKKLKKNLTCDNPECWKKEVLSDIDKSINAD